MLPGPGHQPIQGELWNFLARRYRRDDPPAIPGFIQHHDCSTSVRTHMLRQRAVFGQPRTLETDAGLSRTLCIYRTACVRAMLTRRAGPHFNDFRNEPPFTACCTGITVSVFHEPIINQQVSRVKPDGKSRVLPARQHPAQAQV